MNEIKEIIEGCLSKDRLSQRKLYAMFYPALFSLCKTFFSDKHEALTALNNGMLNVFKNIDKFDETKGTLFNWIYTIVRHAAIDHFLIHRKKLVHELTEDTGGLHEVNPFKRLEWKDIYHYLDQLPPTTRCVCTLYYIEGYRIDEIGQSLDMKEGTVKWYLSECRKKLKIIFENNIDQIA